MTTSNPSRLRVALGALLALAAGGLFARGLAHDFVSLDDPTYVTANRLVQQGLSFSGVEWAFGTSFHAANWHPLTWLSHMADAELYGLDASGHHLTSSVLHGVNTLLLLVALVLLTRDYWPSLLAAAVFALHPLHVESVAWVSERKDVLSGLFWMTTLIAYGWYAQRPSPGRYVLVLASFCLGLLSKPMVVTLPFVLLLLDVWPLARGSDRASLLRLVREKLPLFALAGVFCAVTVVAQRSGRSIQTIDDLDWAARVSNGVLSYGVYVWKFLWPLELACFYPHPALVSDSFSFVTPGVLVSALVLIAISWAAFRWRHTSPHVLVGWLWFLGTLVPVIGLFQVGGQAMADRYTYLPLIGVAIAFAWSARALARRSHRTRFGVVLASSLLILAWSGLSWRQIGTWKNSLTLYEHALSVTERNYFALNNYGLALEGIERKLSAEKQYRLALEIRPENPEVLVNLGALLQNRGELDEARALYERALEADPEKGEALNNMGALAVLQGDISRALRYLESAVRLDPGNKTALRNLVRVHELGGDKPGIIRYRELLFALEPESSQAAFELALAYASDDFDARARETLETALELDPRSVPILHEAAKLARKQGRVPDAIESLKQALDVDPEWSAGYAELGQIQLRLQNWRAAIQWLQRCVEIDPEDLNSVNYLAWTLATCPDKTLRNAEKAMELAGDAVRETEERSAGLLSTLAAACAEAGRFDDAVLWQKKALAAAPPTGKAEMRTRLEKFEARATLGG